MSLKFEKEGIRKQNIQGIEFPLFSYLDVPNGKATNGKVAPAGGVKVAKKGIHNNYCFKKLCLQMIS